MTFFRILERIREERKRQDELHPNFPDDDGVRYTILGEEFGEIGTAIQNGDKENLKEELIQTAAVCIRWLDAIDKKTTTVKMGKYMILNVPDKQDVNFFKIYEAIAFMEEHDLTVADYEKFEEDE